MILLATCGEHEFHGEQTDASHMTIEVRRGTEGSRERIDSWIDAPGYAREAIVAWCAGRLGATPELLWSPVYAREVSGRVDMVAPPGSHGEYGPLRLDDQDINGVLTRALFKRQRTPRHPAADLLAEREGTS